jgi:hypothetical protein
VRTRSWVGRGEGGRGPSIRLTDGPEEIIAEIMLAGSVFVEGLEDLMLSN